MGRGSDMKKILLLMLASSPLWADVQCTTLDGSGFTQDQRLLAEPLAYEVAYAIQPSIQPPTVTQQGTNVRICFTDPQFDVPSTITIPALVAQYQIDSQQRQQATQQVQAWQTELSTTTAAAGVAYNNWGSLSAQQKDTVAKGVVRIIQLRSLLGIQ